MKLNNIGMGGWGSKINRPSGAGVWITFRHFFDKLLLSFMNSLNDFCFHFYIDYLLLLFYTNLHLNQLC